MGSQETPKVYKVRLLPDKNQDFYLKYFYHFFQTDDGKTYYIKCPKTHGFDHFCPWCYVNQQLYKGTDSDKKRAYRYKRNERFVSNIYIIDDPRDVDAAAENKVNGTVRLYEFPATVEGKIKNELTNDDEGFGPAIFDPEKGHDLQIKILAKKPDKNNKVWPDYSLTEFSRKAYPIADTEEKINEIMDSVYDLSEYIEKMGKSWDEHEKLLKSELVWDDVEDAFIRNVGKPASGDSGGTNSNNQKEEEDLPFEPDNDEPAGTDASETSTDADDDTDENDLLEELKNL